MMTIQKRNKFPVLWCLLLLLVSVISFWGCGADETQTFTAERNSDKLYVYAANNRWGVLNAQGKFIIEPQPYDLRIIRDEFTYEPKYIRLCKPTPGDSGQYTMEEAGLGEQIHTYYWNNQYSYDIYDITGNLLYNDFQVGYFWAIGNFLIFHETDEDGFTLINRETQEITFMEADDIAFFRDLIVFSRSDEHCARFYHSEDFSLVKELPSYTFSYKDEQDGKLYFVARKDGLIGLFDENFHILLPAQYTYIEKIVGNFVLAEDNHHQDTVINIATGETVLAPEKNRDIYYYDSNMALFVLYDEYNNRTFSLVNLKDESKQWTAPSILTLSQNTGNAPIGFFIESANSEAIIVSPNGEVLLDLPAQCWVEGVGNNIMTIKYNREEGRPVKLYTLDGKQIPTARNYTRIYICRNNGPLPYLVGYYKSSQGAYQCDLLDEKGNILAEHFTANDTLIEEGGNLAFFCDGYRILGQKGFSQGMMDMEGSWIYKESIFDSLGNEF